MTNHINLKKHEIKEAYRFFLIISQSPFLQVNQFPMFYLEFAKNSPPRLSWYRLSYFHFVLYLLVESGITVGIGRIECMF